MRTTSQLLFKGFAFVFVFGFWVFWSRKHFLGGVCFFASCSFLIFFSSELWTITQRSWIWVVFTSGHATKQEACQQSLALQQLTVANFGRLFLFTDSSKLSQQQERSLKRKIYFCRKLRLTPLDSGLPFQIKSDTLLLKASALVVLPFLTVLSFDFSEQFQPFSFGGSTGEFDVDVLHTIEHLVISLSPLVVSCEPKDLGQHWQ